MRSILKHTQLRLKKNPVKFTKIAYICDKITRTIKNLFGHIEVIATIQLEGK